MIPHSLFWLALQVPTFVHLCSERVMRALTGILLLFVFSLGFAKKVVSFRVRASEPQALEIGRSKRDVITTKLVDVLEYYELSLTIGSPPQNVSARVDTGSSDFWLMSPDNPYCINASSSDLPDSNQTSCENSWFFDREKSSTWSRNSTMRFKGQYIGGLASGDYGQDDISIGGKVISQANFAVANESNCSYTLFGIGPRYGEASVAQFGPDRDDYAYDNIPIQMKQQGLTSSVSYSLFLDSYDKRAGTLLFGGVDHAKYKGDLGIVPVLRYYQQNTDVQIKEPTWLVVMLHGIGIEDDAGNEQWLVECSIPVQLDSGTKYSVIPSVLADPIGKALDADYSSLLGSYVIYCTTTGYIILNFSGVHVKVAISDLLAPLYSLGGDVFTDDYGNAGCAFGISNDTEAPDSRYTYIIGTSVLRSLYVVYDLENWEIGIAAADLESESEDIEEITDGIPGSSASSYSSTTVTSNYSTAQEVTVYPTATNLNSTAISRSTRSTGYTPLGSSSRARTRTQSLGVKTGGLRPSSAQESSSMVPSPTPAISSGSSQAGSSQAGSSQPFSGTSEAASPSSDGSVPIRAANLWVGIVAYLI